MTVVENLFIYWVGRHNLGPGRQFQQIYQPGKPTGRISLGHLDRVSYGLDKSSLKSIKGYLSNRKQRVKIKIQFVCKTLFEVPQGSVLGLFLIIFSYAIFFTFLRTLVQQIMLITLHHITRVNVSNLLSISQKKSSAILFKRLNNNYMKGYN